MLTKSGPEKALTLLRSFAYNLTFTHSQYLTLPLRLNCI